MKIVGKGTKRGLSTVITVAILLSATAIMGATVVSFMSSNITESSASLENTLSEKINLLKESIFIEHYWLVGPPTYASKYVNITVVNMGEVGLSITDIEFVDSSNGATLASFSVIGDLKPKETVSFEQSYNWISGDAFDIIVTTARGNSYKIEDVFSDAIPSANYSPILTGVTPGIPDVSKSGTNQSELIPLEDYFQDIEDLDDLNYTLIADTFSGVWDDPPAINNVANTLFLDFQNGGTGMGSGIITIRATDSGGLFVESTFNVSKT